VSVPPALTASVLDGEYPAVVVWAGRHGWAVTRPAGGPSVRAATYHPSGQLIEVVAALEGYPAVPPTWRFVCPGSDQPATTFPDGGAQPGVGGSIFHPGRFICAPWNQLAYSQHGGPHGEWIMTGWQEVGGSSRATTLADMLDQLHLHLRASTTLS
jgi:hypothetical protein